MFLSAFTKLLTLLSIWMTFIKQYGNFCYQINFNSRVHKFIHESKYYLELSAKQYGLVNERKLISTEGTSAGAKG